MVKVIGIDPGLASTGIGIVSGKGLHIQNYSYGSIHTSSTNALPHRLNQIYSQLHLILSTEVPDLMVVEDVFILDKFPRSGIVLGKVCGIILLAGALQNIPILEIPVREAKQVLTGNGNASKSQLEKSVRSRLALTVPIKPDHASDALGLAMIGLFRHHDAHRMAQALPGVR
jgi:crossover junction endodeoxyribonuclease RuvC